MIRRVSFIVFIISLLFFCFVTLKLPGLIKGKTNTVKEHSDYQISPQAAALHQSLFIADLHSDSLLFDVPLIKKTNIGHVDVPRLAQGNVSLQVLAAATKSPSNRNYHSTSGDSDDLTHLVMAQLWPMKTWHSIYERAVHQLDKLISLAEDNPQKVIFIKNKSDFAALVNQYKSSEITGFIYAIEGAHPFEGKLENLDALYEKGLRIVGLTHFFDNEIGGSLHGVSKQGLTAFGREVVSRANEHSMIIDIAHASPQMVRDVLELSTDPVILSHGGFKGTCDTGRNLDDALMQSIAEKGGIIGVGYWPGAICDMTPLGITRTIRYGIDLLGVEHIALGSDYDGGTEVLFDTSELAILTQTMLEQGFSEHEIRAVMGENIKRFMLNQLPQ